MIQAHDPTEWPDWEVQLLHALLAGCLEVEIPQTQEPGKDAGGSNPNYVEPLPL